MVHLCTQNKDSTVSASVSFACDKFFSAEESPSVLARYGSLTYQNGAGHRY